MIRALTLCLLLPFAVAASDPAPTLPPPPPLPPEQAATRAHVQFLASDALKGREAASPEYEIAAEYVASAFSAAGLKPAGDAGSYLQRVPLLTYTAADHGRMAWQPVRGAATALVFGTDYVPAADPRSTNTRAAGEVVFVGHGVSAPTLGHDDYAGLDVRGKIVAFVLGQAKLGHSEIDASFDTTTRLEEAQRRGAIGALYVTDIAADAYPGFDWFAKRWDRTGMTWAKADGQAGGAAARGVPVLGYLSLAGAAKLFGRDWAKVEAAAKRKAKRLPRLTPAGRLEAETNTTHSATASSNVAGLLPGRDASVADEVVVLTAHLDHIGVEKTGEGDRINNGALDNALGVAILIEQARRFAAAPQRPRRSILFLAVTAEEKGLVGAEYFARNPTLPADRLVANVNLDMPVLLYPFSDLIAFGADRSSLGPIVHRAADTAGVALSPDPSPQEAFFVRSDHYRFVERGVPSVFVWPGQQGPGGEAFGKFLKSCYHKPCDDLAQPIQWDQVARFTDVNHRIAREIADAPARPVWNKGDWFGARFGGPMAE